MASQKLPELQIGVEAEDITSGVQGIIIGCTHDYTGMLRFMLQPKTDPKKKNEMPEAWTIDHVQLKVIGKGLIDNVIPPGSYEPHLGEEVEDIVSKMTGIVTACHVHMNGCVGYTAQPAAQKDKNEKPKAIIVWQQFARFTGNSITKVIPETKTKRPPGGPAERMERF